MEKDSKTKREYTMKDSSLVEQSDVIIRLFKEDMPHFAPFDPGLNSDYVEDWERLLGDVLRLGFGTETLKQQTKLKGEIVELVEECLKYIKIIKYYLSLAFPNDLATQTSFGVSKLGNIKSQPDKLINMMKIVLGQIEANKTTLTGAGLSERTIEEMGEVFSKLEITRGEYLIIKKERVLSTHRRVKQLNALYERWKRVRSAVKIIFADNYVKLQQYRISG